MYVIKVDVDSKNPILAQKTVSEDMDLLKGELMASELEITSVTLGDDEYTVIADSQPFLVNKYNISAFSPSDNVEDSGIYFGSVIICKSIDGVLSSLSTEDIDHISKNSIVMRTEDGLMAPCVIFGSPFKNMKHRDQAVRKLNEFIDFFNKQLSE